MANLGSQCGSRLRQAIEAITSHGQKAPQHIVDQMQAAIRGGNDAKAVELERILRMIEDHLEGSR